MASNKKIGYQDFSGYLLCCIATDVANNLVENLQNNILEPLHQQFTVSK